MSGPSFTGKVLTVLGPVPPESLGRTSIHDHLLLDFSVVFRPPSGASDRRRAYQPVSMANLGWVRYDPFRSYDNLQLQNEDVAVSEVLLFKRAGGGTIVDSTTIGIARDPLALARIARSTGVNIVMGAGYYVDAVHPSGMSERHEEDIAREISLEVTSGVGDTGVRAGIIGELGCSWPLTENERKVLRAAAGAQRETGAAITIHPGRNEAAPHEILDVLAGAGADVSRVVIGHLGRTYTDIQKVLKVAERGCYLQYDQIGWEASNFPFGPIDFPSDAQRLGFIKSLVDEGHATRVLMGQDVCSKHGLVKYGGYGYAHLLEHIVPRMRDMGISEEDIDTIIVNNPARVLTLS